MDVKTLIKGGSIGGGLGLVAGVVLGLAIVQWLEIPAAEPAAVQMILILAVTACTALGVLAGGFMVPKRSGNSTGDEPR